MPAPYGYAVMAIAGLTETHCYRKLTMSSNHVTGKGNTIFVTE